MPVSRSRIHKHSHSDIRMHAHTGGEFLMSEDLTRDTEGGESRGGKGGVKAEIDKGE